MNEYGQPYRYSAPYDPAAEPGGIYYAMSSRRQAKPGSFRANRVISTDSGSLEEPLMMKVSSNLNGMKVRNNVGILGVNLAPVSLDSSNIAGKAVVVSGGQPAHHERQKRLK